MTTLAFLLLIGSAADSFAERQPRSVPGRLVVKLRKEADVHELANALLPYRGQARYVLAHSTLQLVELAEKDVEHALAVLRRHEAIEFAERDFLAEPAWVTADPDVVSGQAWHIAKVQAPTAWDVTAGATNLIVAVLDSGVNFSHPDLSGRLLTGYDFVNADADASDDYGHGTAVTGVVAATGNNNLGGAGVAFGCVVLPLKVCGADGCAAYSAIAAGIRYAVDHGARIINISLVGDQPSAALQDAVNYAWARNAVVIAAAGNTADATPQYPAACQHAVAVSASASNDNLCSFSSHGPHIGVAAPGEAIWTTQMRTNAPFGAWSGTSLASPVVAGVVALMASANNSLSNTQLVSVLTQTADDIGATGFDSSFGYGRVNARRAVVAAVSGPPAITTQPQSQSVLAGGVAVLNVVSQGSDPRAYQWRLNGVNLAGATNATFAKSDVQLCNAGNYSVVVSNPLGSVTSAVASVTITAPQPQILGLSGTAFGGITINWSAVSGATYRVQFKASLTDSNWAPLMPDTLATGSTATFVDHPNGAAQRFYRVLRLP